LEEQLGLQKRELDGPVETDNFTLFKDVWTHCDGTGKIQWTLLWIWLATSSTDDTDSTGDHILSVEWAKSRAQAAQAKEEVLLLCEEMRHVLELLEWKVM